VRRKWKRKSKRRIRGKRRRRRKEKRRRREERRRTSRWRLLATVYPFMFSRERVFVFLSKCYFLWPPPFII
jgi:hypothetical protein